MFTDEERNVWSQLTAHAKKRMWKRSLSVPEILAVIRYGQRHFTGGCQFIFLGKRDAPDNFKYLEGTTVVLEDGKITTVYKNKDALKTIKRKVKFNDKSFRTRYFGDNESSIRECNLSEE